MLDSLQSDVLIAGGGLAGIVTALECVRSGKTVTLVDRDTPERLGGLALWAFGGMTLVGTSVQKRRKIPDNPELALRDWLRFGELGENDVWERKWAQYYVEHSCSQVYDWLTGYGLKFMGTVNWVERGNYGADGVGNTLPRYHLLWGTGRELVRVLLAALRTEGEKHPGRLRIFHRHTITELLQTAGRMSGAVARDEENQGKEVHFEASAVVLAMGGINGSQEEVRANWAAEKPCPTVVLNGSNPYSDGKLHHWSARHLGANLTHLEAMWNYAAGIAHPFPHFPEHGLSLVPCKSALWLNHRGERIGPAPLVTGFDTHDLCQQVAKQEKPYTWHILNWRIAARELSVSGAEHNPAIRDHKTLSFLCSIFFGNHRLVRQLQKESKDFLVDATIAGLVSKMNSLTGNDGIKESVLQETVDAFDANFIRGLSFADDDQIRRILHARAWFPDRLRTCQPQPLKKPGAGPYIAIRLQLITRKSLGGMQTDLDSRVLNDKGLVIPDLYCVGEAAGFGGGGASGKRSLEGTFLAGCILTARAAARSINQ